MAFADGTNLLGATTLFKINASATARMRGRLVLNGTTEIRGSLGEISATNVSLATAIWLQTMVPLGMRRCLAHRDLIRRMSALNTYVLRDRFTGVVMIE